MRIVDLRSDTVTKPCRAMRQAMAEAPVGDDVYGEDPTVNQLENVAAEMTGKEAALFATSGTQTNLLGLLAHCGRGDEYIVGQQAHTYKYEGGGAAVLGSIQPQPLDFESDGTLDLKKVAAAVKPDDVHFARSRLLCLENTHNGLALPLEYPQEAKRCAEQHALKLHLDGARLCNAAVFHQQDLATLCAPFDSVSLCLSKGLGAPVGSVLCGSRDCIAEARKWRKMVGGGMRQAGVLAAAALYALEHNIKRLAQDHENARQLACGLKGIEELRVEYGEAQTNMVFIEHDRDINQLVEALRKQNIIISGGRRIRLVTHLDVHVEDIARTVMAFQSFFAR